MTLTFNTHINYSNRAVNRIIKTWFLIKLCEKIITLWTYTYIYYLDMRVCCNRSRILKKVFIVFQFHIYYLKHTFICWVLTSPCVCSTCSTWSWVTSFRFKIILLRYQPLLSKPCYQASPDLLTVSPGMSLHLYCIFCQLLVVKMISKEFLACGWLSEHKV